MNSNPNNSDRSTDKFITLKNGATDLTVKNGTYPIIIHSCQRVDTALGTSSPTTYTIYNYQIVQFKPEKILGYEPVFMMVFLVSFLTAFSIKIANTSYVEKGRLV